MGIAVLRITGAVSTCYLLATAGGAVAEPASFGVEEVVVTAQRAAVAQNAQSVPVAVTSVDLTTARLAGLTDVTDLGSFAPNVQTATVGTTPNFLNFSIRGIGTNGSIRSVDPAVNVIQDGMVIAYQAGVSASTFDLEAVEVLRGPQGALFGRNATGGAILIRTRPPSADQQAFAELVYDNSGGVQANASVEGPLLDRSILAKLALIVRRSNGYIDNTNDGSFVVAPGNPTGAAVNHGVGAIGSLDEITLRPTIRYILGDQTTLTLFGQLQHFDDGGSAPRNFIPANGPAVPLESFFGFTPAARDYATNIANDGYADIRSEQMVAELRQALGAANITTTIAAREVRFNSTVNFTGGPFLMVLFPDNRERNGQLSLESQINVPLPDARAEITGGVFFLDTTTQVLEKRLQGATSTAALGTDIYTQSQYEQRTRAAALFENAEFHLTDSLTASVGGRFSWEQKRFDGTPLIVCPGQSYNNCSPPPTDIEKSWAKFTPRASLSYDINPSAMAYVTYAQGFRSGNFNNRVTSAAGLQPANPESVDSYEVGLKQELIGRTVRINADAFVERYRDIQQILLLNTPGQVPVQTLINAADARIAGGELELEVKPVAAVKLEANLGYTDARFLKFNEAVPGVTDPTTLRFARIPKCNFEVASTYSWLMPAVRWPAEGRVSYNWRSSYPTDLQNTPQLVQRAYGILDADLAMFQGSWTVGVFARNLLNTVYADSKGRNFAYVAWGGSPRSYGLRLSKKFN